MTAPEGAAGIRTGVDVLAVIPDCRQVLNPCNNFNPAAIEVVVPG